MSSVSMCIGTAHIFRRLAEEASDTSLQVLAKHLDLPMDDAETVDYLRSAMRAAYVEISTAMHKDRIEHARRYARQPEGE